MSCATHGCPALRPGSTACHCAGCHRTFSNLTLFDQHQDWRANLGSPSCKAPAALGLVRANETWWTPEGLQASTERVGRMHQARKEMAA